MTLGSWEARARIVFAARKHAGLTCQSLMRRLSGVVVTEAQVGRLESGKACVTDDYVIAVLRACGLPGSWRPIMACAEHITQDERLYYVEWHNKAEESERKGETQARCGECGLLFFPWEMRAAKEKSA